MLADDDPRHGTSNGYTNLGCRCQPCRDANAAVHQAYMLAHPEQQEKQRARMRKRYWEDKAEQEAYEAEVDERIRQAAIRRRTGDGSAQ